MSKGVDLQNKSHPEATNLKLGEVATQYLKSLSAEEKHKSEKEVNNFVRWYMGDRPISELTVPVVANYSEQINSYSVEPAKKLEPVKTFLTYTYKQGFTKIKLASQIKIKKPSLKSSRLQKQSAENSISLTAEGYAELEAELSSLIDERPRVADELRKAAADKDFKENAPLDAAREYQGQLEARINQLESILKVATIMGKHSNTHIISIGNTVSLQDLTSGELFDYTLVDASEANPSKGKISIASPIGQALLGHKKSDEIKVNAPAGVIPFRIEDIKKH